ncbi:MAG: dihydrofolate reductase family protein [Bacteroidota bacterium]
MAQKVFFDMTISLDGFIAPEGMEMEHFNNSDYKQWLKKWMELQAWVFPLKYFRKNLKLEESPLEYFQDKAKIEEDAETNALNQSVEETFNRTGASIMGATMFAGGEKSWPEEAPFHTNVYVLTHKVRTPWERPGGTTFYFVNDGMESALKQAKQAAGRRDIRIAGGADVVRQYLNAGFIDEFTLHYSPVFFGNGTQLFANVNPDINTRVTKTLVSENSTHVTYEIIKK